MPNFNNTQVQPLVEQDLMMQVHNNGKAIIWSGNKEKAEFYVQQLHTHQLTASLETV